MARETSVVGEEMVKRYPFKDITDLLPHRHPMLFLDLVEIIREDETFCAEGRFHVSEDKCPGHFPDNPIFPGVHLIEMAAQTLAILYLHQYPAEKARLPYLADISGVRFRGKGVRPGQKLVAKARIDRIRRSNKAPLIFASASVFVEEENGERNEVATIQKLIGTGAYPSPKAD